MVVVNVAASVADVVVMPGIHRAADGGGVQAFLKGVSRRGGVVLVPLTLVTAAGGWWWLDGAAWTVLLPLVLIPPVAGLSALYVGALNAAGRFRQAVAGPLYGAVVAVPALYLLPSTAEGLALALLLFEAARTLGLRHHFRSSYPAREAAAESGAGELLANASRNAGFQVVGALFVAMNPMIDILVSRGLGEGAVSLVEYSSRLAMGVPLFFVGVLTVVYARWSRAASGGVLAPDEVHRMAVKTGVWVTAAALAIVLLAEPVVELLLGGGKMGAEQRSQLVTLLIWYVLANIPYVTGLVYVRALVASQRVALITLAAAVSFGANLLLDLSLVVWFGLAGVGIATLAAQSMVALYLAAAFRGRSLKRFGGE